MINNTVVEFQHQAAGEQQMATEAEVVGVTDPTSDPVPPYTLSEDMEVEMNPMVSMVDQDDRFVTMAEPTLVVVQSPEIANSNSVSNSVTRVNMGEPFYRFSDSRKQSSYLNLTPDSYRKLSLNKDITFFHSQSSSFMTVRLLGEDSRHDRRKMEFITSTFKPRIQQLPSTKDEDLSSVGESSSASCLMQQYSPMEHESIVNPGDNQRTGNLEIPSR